MQNQATPGLRDRSSGLVSRARGGEEEVVFLSDVRAQRVALGATGLEVSRLCWGLGSSGCGTDSMQGHLPVTVVADYLLAGLELGVTWWDTSDDYGSQPHVREALRRVPREQVQLTTKTHAGTAGAVRDSVQRSMRELGVDYVDVVLLHEVDSLATLEARQDGLTELHRLREQGKVGAVGLSTHCIEVLEVCAGHPRLQVLLTNFNFAEVHMDASLADYRKALHKACAAGQGVALMKTLGEGVLASRLQETLCYNLEQDFAHGVLVGVTSLEQVQAAATAWSNWRTETR